MTDSHGGDTVFGFYAPAPCAPPEDGGPFVAWLTATWPHQPARVIQHPVAGGAREVLVLWARDIEPLTDDILDRVCAQAEHAGWRLLTDPELDDGCDRMVAAISAGRVTYCQPPTAAQGDTSSPTAAQGDTSS